MIEFVKGDMLADDVEALVNTVNTKGVMGKGIALQFKQTFPANYEAYRRACARGEVKIGQMFVFRTGALGNPKWIINFPTKVHWRTRSRLEYIQKGLPALITVVRTYGIKSLAIPPLGAGSGGLDWTEVRPIIEAAVREMPEIRVLVHDPFGAPAPATMRIGTSTPRMTAGRAALLGVLGRYVAPGYRLALVEIQKLAYFLQTAGEPLKLTFSKEQYGPYAETLNHVLQRIEGHFIRGYGDRSQAAPIKLLEPASGRADEVINADPGMRTRLDLVGRLIEGFETPYGLELLASVHWVSSMENSMGTSSPEVAIALVHKWSKRKAERFDAEHIRRAWKRLHDEGWMERKA